MLGIGHVVTTSVGMCDIDIRPVSIISRNNIFGTKMNIFLGIHINQMCTLIYDFKDK